MSESPKSTTETERTSDREVTITRTVNGPPHLVFEAWAKPELFLRWWLPKSIGIQVFGSGFDIRTGGSYRLVLGRNASEQMTFHGRYLEVTPHTKLVWSNEESDQGSVTTVTFEESSGKTRMIVSELFPTKEALDAALASGELERDEPFDQLDAMLAG